MLRRRFWVYINSAEGGMASQFERLVCHLKTKLKALKMKQTYNKIDKSESMRMEIRSRRARKLIAETMEKAESLGTKGFIL
ncbi:hypothetical protein EJ110_NYTH12396 [Nymphaea thermarum]|nr:hypothetical protein EJ110_NYTH12396 [Nymphaea thermarum]